ncbi:MAG: glycosyltransferase [Bacteroidales bacterium]
MFDQELSTEIIILLLLFGVAALAQLFFNLWFYRRLTNKRYYSSADKSSADKKRDPVSVIICARNEADNLKENLPFILDQNYPDFEVIVVNDCSEDETEEVLTELAGKYSNLRISTIHKESSLVHSKKLALFIGIKAARNDILLLTDADCRPVSPEWISLMAENFSDETSFVLGYGGFLGGKGILNRYIRYDAMVTALRYITMTMAGRPYMGVGRNLAYRRSLFFRNRGFGPNLYLQAGDDDLFVNRLANSKNCRIQSSPDSFTRSAAVRNRSSFWKQKTRHIATTKLYRPGLKIVLASDPATRILLWILFPFIIAGGWLLPITIPLFGIVWLTRIIILRRAQKVLNETDLLLHSLLFDIVSPIISAIFLTGSRMNRHQSWEWK